MKTLDKLVSCGFCVNECKGHQPGSVNTFDILVSNNFDEETMKSVSEDTIYDLEDIQLLKDFYEFLNSKNKK